MTGSFLFVKPSNPDGTPGTEYSNESPPYTYDRASWEWLLERALRRTLIPWALTKSHSRVLLYGHEDKYSMHRWGSYGYNYDAGTTPGAYQSVGGPGSDGRMTDADLSGDDRTTSLPHEWESEAGVPTYSETPVAYGVSDLENTIAELPFSLEWLSPDWIPSLDAWDLTAKTTEKTQGSTNESKPFGWTWETTADHTPYTIPHDLPFKCLSHMRTDDPTVKVTITNDDDAEIEVETAPTPVSPRTTTGSIGEYYGKQVRVAGYGAAERAGWALYEFGIECLPYLDYGQSTSESWYHAKTPETDESIGRLVDVPGADSGNIMNSYGWFIHEVDWGGKQTWWHANKFPKGLDSVVSTKLREQLQTLCPVCQPAIPPAIPAFRDRFPGSGKAPWDRRDKPMYPPPWMRHLALACTPADMSARLDAMTTTVHRVPTIFAKIKSESTEDDFFRNDYTYKDSNGAKEETWVQKTSSVVTTVEGTTSEPIPSESRASAYPSTKVTRNHVSTRLELHERPDITKTSFSKDQASWTGCFKSNSDFLVCLRSTDNTTLSTKTTTKYTYALSSSNLGQDKSAYETSDGDTPVSYNPDPDDLLFPDWVLPWIETAELFASIESCLIRLSTPDYTENSSYTYPEGGEIIDYSISGKGFGTRDHKAHRAIVSLGQMDMETGRFPELDVASVLSYVDPDPNTASRGKYIEDDVDETYTETTDEIGITTADSTKKSKGADTFTRTRSVSYYVVVRWKFDREDPETLKTEIPLAGLHRKLADARKALSDKERELSDARSALSDAQSDLQSAKDALSLAQERLEDPEGAEPALVAEAQVALDRANKVLSDAQSETSRAQSAYDDSKASRQLAQAAYDDAVKTGEGVEEAKATLEDAKEAYVGAAGKLADAEANETEAQSAADAAQDYLDTLHDKIEEILQKAVGDAQARVDEATSRVDECEKKIKEAEGAIPGLEAAVKAAEEAIRDAEGTVA